MGIGSATGEDAASKAMRAALDYKLLEENSITGAKAALINVTGGEHMPLGEIEDAIGMIEEESDDNADIIWGNVIKEGMNDEIKVTVIATGFDRETPKAASPSASQTPVDLQSYTTWKQETGERVAAATGVPVGPCPTSRRRRCTRGPSRASG